MDFSQDLTTLFHIAGHPVWAHHIESRDADSVTAMWVTTTKPIAGTPPSGIVSKTAFMALAGVVEDGDVLSDGTPVSWTTATGSVRYGTVWAYVRKGSLPAEHLSSEYLRAYAQETTNRIRFNPNAIDKSCGRYILKMTDNPRGGVPVLHIRKAHTVQRVSAMLSENMKLHPGGGFSSTLYEDSV